jgi:hypothetical protein
MRGLLSTAASRAWMGVVAAGVVVVAIVLGLQLLPRLTAGQEVIDAAKPAMTAAAVEGEVAGTKHLSEYVDLVDPLLTRGGGGSEEVDSLVALVARRTGISRARARAFLRREAPRTEALLRALPLTGVADERNRLATYLATTLNVTAEDLQDQLAREFPGLFQTLAELTGVTDGWYDVPGIEGLARFNADKPVRTVPGLRKYLRDDLVGTVQEEQDRFEALAGKGGIGYIPTLLLVIGAGLIVFGLVHARWSRHHPSGRIAWGAVAVVGLLIAAIVGALGYFPRLSGAKTTIARFEPAFERPRVEGLRAGSEFLVRAVRFGDPIATRRGGAAAEVPRLVTFVSGQAGVSEAQVRRRLREVAPRTFALLEAIPLSAVAREQPALRRRLARTLRAPGDRLERALRRAAPGLTQALLASGPVTAGWNAIPGTEDLRRFDGVTGVRSAPEFAAYLDGDVVPLFEAQGENFDTLAGTWPPVDVLPIVIVAFGGILLIYGVTMLFLATPARRG